MRRFCSLSVLAVSILLSGCSLKPAFVNEYKIDVQQGNVLTQEMVSQLKPGQTQGQVRFLLGTPMIMDAFHQDRWDYVYRYQNGQTGEIESRKFAVFFGKDGKLERVSGDVAEGGIADLTAPVARVRQVDLGSLPEQGEAFAAPKPEAPGYFRRFMNMIGL